VTETQSEIAELNEEENAVVDEDEYEEGSDEDEEPDAVDTKLEQLQAEHKAKIEADKEEQRKLLESRTPEQQQAIVDSLTQGQVITNGVTTGEFVEKTEDGGIVVAQKGKKQKMSPATVQNVTTATATDPEPTQEKAKIAVLEETNDLGAAGFKPTGETDEDGGEILEDKRKDGLGKPFTVSTKLFRKKDGTTVNRSFFTYAPKKVRPQNAERTQQAEKLNVLRVMNQGVEVRVPNNTPAPAWMTVRPVEGKDYSIVVTAEYEENGINVGTFNATDPQGSFENAYKKNQAIKNIKVDASNQNRASREKAGTDATTKAAKRIQGASPLIEMLFSVISKPWFKSVESQIASDSLSGLGLQGQEEYRKLAANKIQNALSKISLEPKKGAEVKGAAGLVAKTAELFVSGTNASEIPKLVLEGRPQNTEETKLVNRTVTALGGELSIFASPSKHIAALEQVKTEALKFASLRPDDVSMDAKKEDGEDAQGDNLTASQLIQDSKQGKKGASKVELAAPGKLSVEELETMVEADKLAKTALESGFLEKLEEWKKSLTKLELLALDYLNAPDRTSQYELKRTVEEQLLFLRDRRTFKQLLASVERRAAELAEEVAGVKADDAIPRRAEPKSRVAISAENIAAAKEQNAKLSFQDRQNILKSEGLSEDEIAALSDDDASQQVVQLFALNNAAAKAPKAETKTAEPKKTKTVYDQETKTFKAATATPVAEAEAAVEQVALTPDEKFADDYLNEPDAEKQQGMLDAFEKPRIEEAQAKIIERGIDQPTAKKIAENKVKQKTTELISAAYQRRSPQSPGKAKGAAKEIKGAPGRKPSSPKLQRIKRRFLQAKVGLSDEQMVGMSNAEVDRAYLAYNSRADENKAAAAQDAVVSVAPGIERLVELGDQELVGAYADAILAAEKEGDYGKLRDLNFNELVRFGAFESTRELLTRLADPKNKAPRDMQVRAKAFLEMEKRGLKLDNIEVQAANFLKTGTKDRAVWGGLLGRNADYSAFGVYINLDQAHDRETPLQTVLHELAHVATFAKVHGKVKTTAQEDRIIKDLERMRRAAILKAGNASPAMKAAADKAGATTPEARLANYEKALKAMIASGEEGSRRYNGLQNLDEFIVEMTGSPDFVKLLSQLGFGAVNADKRTFNGMIRDAFNAILKLIGVNINPSSELGKAFMDSWNFTFRGTKYKAAPSELLKAVRGVAEAKAEPKTAAKAAKSQSDKSSIPAPQGEAEVKPEGNNQVTKPTAKKAKRAKAGRPTNREMREATELPKTEEEIAAEKAAFEKLLEQESKMESEDAPQSPAAFKTPHVLHTVRDAEDIPKILNGIRNGTNITIDSTKPNQSIGAGGITLVIEPQSVEYKSKGYNSNEGTISKESKPRIVEILVDRDGYGQPGVTQEDIDRSLERVTKLESDWDQAKSNYRAVLSRVNEQGADTGRVSQELGQELKAAEQKRDQAERAYFRGTDFETEVKPSITEDDAIREELSELINRYPVYSFDTDENGNAVEFQKVQSPAAKPRIIRAKNQDQADQDQADLRAANVSDILFYNGITEEDYDKLIDEGILTPNEIEMGYMQDVPKMLSNIAGDDTVPAPLRHVAQMLLDLGFDFSKVRFTETTEKYAGLYEPGTQAKSGRISVNLDSPHEGGIAQTIVHEALHHVFFWKTQKGYPLNRVERAAFRDMEKIFKHAERLALGRYTRAGQTLSQAKARRAPGDLFYGLTNMDEFITEILTNPEFQIFLQQAAPMQGLPKKGGYIRNLLDQIFAYFKDIIYGFDVSGDSLLTQGLDNVLAFIQTPQTEAGVQRAVEQMIGVPAPRATYGGEKADMPQFKRDSLEAARAMAADGKTSEEIRAVTGWFPGKYDGKMRWEIPDDKAGFVSMDDYRKKAKRAFGGEVFGSVSLDSVTERIGSGGYLKLADVLNHKALYDAYPEAKEIPFFPIGGNIQSGRKFKVALERLADGTLRVGDVISSSVILDQNDQISKDSLATLLHEVQHWIQDREGFAQGGSPSTVVPMEMKQNSRRIAELLAEKTQLSSWLEKAEKIIAETPKKKKFIVFGREVDAAEVTRQKSLVDSLKKQLDGLYKKYGVSKETIENPIAKHVFEAEKKYGAGWVMNKNANFEIYKKIAGEIESRDVEARIEFTEDQRKAVEPYSTENIAPEDAILVEPWAMTKAPMSPAGEAMKMIAKLTGAESKTTFNGGTYTAGGALSPDGKLDKQAGDKWRASRQQITAAARVIDTLSTRLVSAVKAAKKSGVEVSTETMNTALGNLDNPLTQAQRSEVRRMREIDEEEANTLEAAHLAKNREAFKVKQRAALAALPANVADAVSEMNEHIAYYSAMLKDSGILDPSMAATVEANLGIYLHRSYEIFDNEKWAKQVRENTKVMQAAERLIKRNIEQRNAAELIRQTESEGGFISKADAQAQTKGTAKQEQIDKAIDDLLAIGEDGMGSVILRGRIPGQKDLSIFDTRGNISPEIQALWGRYEDPTINYAKSVMKMSSLVANHQFLSDLRGLGLKEGWLYNGPEADRPRGYLKISSDNNKSLAPLAGLHGDKLLVEALYQMFPQNGVSDNYAWVRALSKVTGWSMAAKTVLSPVAQVRNNLGNILFDVAAGNFGFSDIPKLKDRMGTAFNMSFRSAFNAYPKEADFRKAMMNEMQELVRRGVIGESIVGNMLGQLMEAKRFSKTEEQFSNHLIGKLQKSAGAVWDTAQKAYASSDDFWKVMGYMAEVDKYTKAMPGWSPEQVKDHAAKIVRDIRPTYSLSPAALDKVKAFPFVAPFITFTTEVIRTSINLMKLARYEITEGNRTGNKELQAIGWKRARGMVFAAFGPGAVATGMMALAGIGRDDEERLRRFLPNWQKNSQLLLTKNKDGKVSYVDVSFLDPYDYWKKASGAFVRSLTARDDAEAMERITRGAMEAASELIRPFKSEQLVSGAIVDVLRNQDATGRPIYNPQDTGANIAAKTTERIWKAFSPGAFDTAGRIIKAGAGAVSDSGRAYNLANELLGLAAGQRITEVDVEAALGFKASKFSRDIRDASSLFTREFNSKGTRSPDQIADAYERANDATYRLTADFRDDVLAAIGLGKISPKKAEEILKANRIGKEDIAMIRSGRYKKYEPSDAAKKIAPKDRIKAADAAVKRAKDTPL
jgi:hypothetical protein